MNLTCSITAAWCQWPFKDRRFKTKINDIFLTACEQINEWSIYKNKVMCILTLQSQETLNKGPGVSVKRMSQHPQRNIPEACIPFTHITLPIIRPRHNSPMPEFPQQPSLGSGYRLTCRGSAKGHSSCTSHSDPGSSPSSYGHEEVEAICHQSLEILRCLCSTGPLQMSLGQW